MSVSPSAAPDDTEPAFTPDFDYTPVDDRLPEGQRWSTWDDIGIIDGAFCTQFDRFVMFSG